MALKMRELLEGFDGREADAAVVVVVGGGGCGRRMGICRICDDGLAGLTTLSSVFVVTLVITGIVRLNRRETEGKRGTFDVVVVGSSFELI